MRYTPEHKVKIREAILAAAGRCLREEGFNGIGVDGIMAAAGLTSGAFYTQFSSKTELLLEVLRIGLQDFQQQFLERQQSDSPDWLKTGVNEYLVMF